MNYIAVFWIAGPASGESSHLPPMWLIPSVILLYMWVEFLGSKFCLREPFPWYSNFPLSLKANVSLGIFI